jgi:MFS family permease
VTAYIFLAYFGQGLAQHFCLISQPLDNYFLKVCHWNASQVAAFMALLMIPWTVKPIFGFISDGLPIFGSTKKAYLGLGFATGGIGYLLASNFITLNLLLSSTGLACASAVSLGLIVQTYAATVLPYIFSLQLFAYYLSLIGSGVLAGWLCNQRTPQEALHTAFWIAGAICLATAIITPFLVQEKRITSHNPRMLLALIKQILVSRKFYLVAAFIFCWSFSPGFGTPLYFHYTNVLHMSQLRIGEANGYHAFGMLSGVLAYSVLWRLASKLQIQISIWLCILTTLSFTLVTSDNVFIFEYLKGVTAMLGALSINALAASVSVPGIETLATAILMSVYNLGTLSSGVVGASMYTTIFHNSLPPLLIMSATTTASCSFLLRFIQKAHC